MAAHHRTALCPIGPKFTCTPTQGMTTLSQPLPLPQSSPRSLLRTGCQTPPPPPCPAQPLHQEYNPEDACRLDIGPRGGRVSNRSLSTALGLRVCCWGEIEELLVPKEPPTLSCP